MNERDAIGDRGEMLFYLAVSKQHGGRPLFRPVFLGAKWPVADLAVELAGHGGMFFLVQVKSSTRGYTGGGERLRISAGRARLQALADAPVPSYLAGVDEPGGRVFLVAARGWVATPKSSVTTKFSLDEADVRRRLHDEVREFWDGVRLHRPWTNSHFIDD